MGMGMGKPPRPPFIPHVPFDLVLAEPAFPPVHQPTPASTEQEETFQELMDNTDWENYGRSSGNPKCADCMVHCGYEPTAAEDAMAPKNIARSLGSVLGFAK